MVQGSGKPSCNCQVPRFGGMVYHLELSLGPNKTIICIHISSTDMVENSVASYSLLVSFHTSDSSVAKLF